MDVVSCVAASDGIAVAPCGTSVNGVAMVPQVVQLPGFAPLDFSQSPELFSWACGIVLLCFVLGLVVGSIIRLIREA